MEISEDDIVKEAFCSHKDCRFRLFDEKMVEAILRKYKDLPARKKAFRKLRDTRRKCPGCEREVERIQWECPICHQSKFGQRRVYLWVDEPSDIDRPAKADEEAGDE